MRIRIPSVGMVDRGCNGRSNGSCGRHGVFLPPLAQQQGMGVVATAKDWRQPEPEWRDYKQAVRAIQKSCKHSRRTCDMSICRHALSQRVLARLVFHCAKTWAFCTHSTSTRAEHRGLKQKEQLDKLASPTKGNTTST